jgi:prepilin-type N-terminal cleavage/methylation domain-containing protein
MTRRLYRSPRKEQAGFTIVELLVVMIVTSIVSVGILMVFTSLSGVFYSQGTRIQNQDDARMALNQIVRFLRMATSSADNMTSHSDAIASASTQNIEFFCDVDGDGLSEKVRYYLDGTTLRMQTAEPVWVTGTNPHYEYPAYNTNGIVVQEAIRNGATPVFTYNHYNPSILEPFTPVNATDREAIATIKVSLVVNEKPELAKSAVRLETDVQIRQRYEGGLE